MATEFVDLLPGIAALADPARRSDLTEVAALVGLSPSRAQRVITRTIGESPKRYERRTAVELGAILLMASDARVIDVAFAVGFQSHENFSRAFAAQFGENPAAWRKPRRGALTLAEARLAQSTSRCHTLYRRPLRRSQPRKGASMSYDITTRDVEPIPVLYQSRRVDRETVGEALGECLPAVFGFVMENALAPAGHPFVRYTNMTNAFFEIDAGIPLVEAATDAPPADSGIIRGELPGGMVAVTVHQGPYEGLSEAYAALERWAEASAEFTAAGAPWEVYLTDPGEVPDPADWMTEVFLPVTAS